RGNVGAHRNERPNSQPEEASVLVKCKLRVRDVIPPVLVSHHRFTAFANPLDGTLEPASGPKNQTMLGRLPSLGTEPAANVVRDDADSMLWDLKDLAEQLPHTVRLLTIRI